MDEHAPKTTSTATHRAAIAASICAAVLSCVASICAIEQRAQTAPAAPTAASAPPAAIPEAAQTPEAQRRREKLKEFLASLTPEQRAQFKQMTPEQRKSMRAQFEASQSKVPAPSADPAR